MDEKKSLLGRLLGSADKKLEEKSKEGCGCGQAGDEPKKDKGCCG